MKNKKEEKKVSDKNLEEENKKLHKQLEEKEKEIEDLTDTLKRVQAEFINYKNRAEKEMDQCRSYSTEDLVKKLLPLLDSFKLALKSDRKNREDFEKGIELIFAQFYNILKQEGLKPIDALGKKFDPYMHEVLLKEKSNKESETILEELQKGYMFKDKVIRHTKVKISE